MPRGSQQLHDGGAVEFTPPTNMAATAEIAFSYSIDDGRESAELSRSLDSASHLEWRILLSRSVLRK